MRGLALLALLVAPALASDDAALLQSQMVWPHPVGSFTDVNETICFEGGNRTIESAVAMRRAGPRGLAYVSSSVKDQSCADRGFGALVSDDDECHMGVKVFAKGAGGREAYPALDRDAVKQWAEAQGESDAFSVEELMEDTHFLDACTCQPGSALFNKHKGECGRINEKYQGNWVHHNHITQKELMCDQGPIQQAAWSLAVLKSYAQNPMHTRDQVSIRGCAAHGFRNKFEPIDHCFTGMHMWTAAPLDQDAGAKEAGAVENALFSGQWEKITKYFNLDTEVLNSLPGCHCAPSSEVGLHLRKAGVCAGQHPIRDWWQD